MPTRMLVMLGLGLFVLTGCVMICWWRGRQRAEGWGRKMGFAALVALGAAVLCAACVMIPMAVENAGNAAAIEDARKVGDEITTQAGRLWDVVTVTRQTPGNAVSVTTYQQWRAEEIGMMGIGAACFTWIVLFLPCWLTVRITPHRREAPGFEVLDVG